MFNKIKVDYVVEVDRSIVKIVILTALGVIFSFIFGYFLKSFIIKGGLVFLLISFSSSLFFLAFFLLGVFFVKSQAKIGQIIFLESLAFSVIFYDSFSLIFAGGVFVGFLLLLWADYSGRLELENMIKIKFWRVGKKVLPKAIAALSLFVGVAYVGSVGIFNEKEFFISRPVFEKMIFPVIGTETAQKFLPGFDLSLSVGELAKSLATNQVEQNSQIKLLPQIVKNQLINQAAKDIEDKFADFAGNPINPKIKSSEALYQVVVGKIFKLPEDIKEFIPIGVIALIFLTIVSLALPIRWLATALAYFFYEICLALNFSVIMLEGKSREIILLK